jgi:hypothetical protein
MLLNQLFSIFALDKSGTLFSDQIGKVFNDYIHSYAKKGFHIYIVNGRNKIVGITFRGFDLNIIVGQLHPDEYGNREPVMCFFGPVVKDGQKPIGMLSISDAAKIINHK